MKELSKKELSNVAPASLNLDRKISFCRIYQSKVLEQAEIQNTVMYDQLKEKISAEFTQMKKGW
jgi:hypothetical protein